MVRQEQTVSPCMVLSTRHTVRNIHITINDDSINVDNDVKCLGVYVYKHVPNVCRKLGHGLQILPIFRRMFTINNMMTIYETIIQHHIGYCTTVWGYAPKCQIQRVERLQNKIFRLITRDYSWNTSPKDILYKLRGNYFNDINVYRYLNRSYAEN